MLANKPKSLKKFPAKILEAAQVAIERGETRRLKHLKAEAIDLPQWYRLYRPVGCELWELMTHETYSKATSMHTFHRS